MVVDVVAGVITQGNSVLLCKRPAGKRHAGMWEFPGGKCEPGESLSQALRRELMEELGTAISTPLSPVYEHQAAGEPFRIHFIPTTTCTPPQPIEHTEVRWVPLDDLANYDMPPSDAQFRLILPSIITLLFRDDHGNFNNELPI